MNQVDGIYANHALLTIINDLVGKEVLVEAADGAKYSGIFTACSPEFDIGLRHAYEITTGNMANLLPKKEEMTTKMLFKFSDIVAMSALMSEEKVIRGSRQTATTTSSSRMAVSATKSMSCTNGVETRTARISRRLSTCLISASDISAIMDGTSRRCSTPIRRWAYSRRMRRISASTPRRQVQTK